MFAMNASSERTSVSAVPQFLTEKDGKQGNDDDIKGGQKACPCLNRGPLWIVQQGKLLKVDADGKEHSADDAAKQSSFARSTRLWQ